MLDQCVRLLDIDGSVVGQRKLMERWHARAQVVGLRHMEPHLRFMSTRSARLRFKRALVPAHRNHLTFYGSGDFHHLSAALVGQWTTPLSLLVFDGHPDWDITSPWNCCGCWINEVLALPNVRRVVVIGLGKSDLHGWHVLRGNLKALLKHKLELFPASWRRSKTLFAPSLNLPGATLNARGWRTEIRWKTVASDGVNAIIDSVLERLPTRDVYLSIDKDCLQAPYARSNWETGELSLDDLCGALKRITACKEIVGADVTGEWSRGRIANPLFSAISNANHPDQTKPTPQQLCVNEQTNLALLEALLPVT